jgi:epoxyqueuosine reductase
MKLSDHPAVKSFLSKQGTTDISGATIPLDADRLRALCREAGADDVGLVKIDAPALNHERQEVLRFFPRASAHFWAVVAI